MDLSSKDLSAPKQQSSTPSVSPSEQDYLCFDQEHYSKLTPLEKQILCAASFVDSFCAEYVVAITSNPKAPETLKSLLLKGLLNKDQTQFALPQEYKPYIDNEFQYLDWDTRTELLKRVVNFTASQGSYGLALSFCLEYEFLDLASEILLSWSETLINAGRFEELRGWFERIPANIIDRDPLLMVYRAWCFPEYQKVNGAESYLEQVSRQLADHGDSIPRDKWLKASVQLLALKGYISRISGKYQDAVHFAEQAVSLAREGYPAILSRLYTTIGQDLYLKGDVIAAEASLVQAMALARQYKKHHDMLISLGYAVASMLLSGRLRKAVSLFQDAMSWFRESDFMDCPEAMVLNDVLIDLHRETFNFVEANELSEKMLLCCQQTSTALHHLTTYMRRYRMAMNIGQVNEAYTALTQTEGCREVLGVSWAFGWLPVPAMRAEFELRHGSLPTASEYFFSVEERIRDSKDFSTEAERFVYAEWLRKVGRIAESRSQLSNIKQQALSENRILHAIKADVQLAVTIFEDDPALAVLHMRDALQLVPDGEQIIGPFLWFETEVLPLLKKVRAKLYQDPQSLGLLNIIEQHIDEYWPHDHMPTVLDQLSERQTTILRLLLEGDQDKVIARKLDISPGTVKTHLRTIYRKLNCSSRAQAVSIAMENGLLFEDEHQIASQ
ncbi:MAG: LuxR C-terminal-related transcriptional regulator [Pseudomonadales bacterium]|nr:LuxR C-terminal-related transcriptional regulator [Pseudomonadales bacterium]